MNANSGKQIFLLNPFASDEHSESRYPWRLHAESVIFLREVRVLLLHMINHGNLLVSKPTEGVWE